MDTPRHILLFCTHGIGDVVMTLPLMRGLRDAFPDAQIEVVLRGRLQADILKGHDFDFQVTAKQELKASKLVLARTLWRWRRRKIDLAISTYNVHARQASWLGKAAGAKRRIGFIRPGQRASFHETLTPAGRHKIDENLRLLEALGGALEPGIEAQPRWMVSAEESAWARSHAAALGLGDRPVIALTPGCTPHEDFKRWPMDRYVDLARQLWRRGAADLLIFGGPGEESMVAPLTALSPPAGAGRVINTVGTLALRQTAALLAQCQLVLGGDCGLTHVASSLGLSTLVLMGPTDPSITAPRGPRTHIIASRHHCLNCYEKDLRIDPNCPVNACMQAISVGEVADAAWTAMQLPEAAPAA